jgi:uncharacterized protein YutE (UPF0331/DUF86 family)
MVNADLVTAKLAELGARVARVRARVPATAGELRGDQDALEIVSFNLMLCVQSAADIASHVVADEGWRPATTLAGAFDRLAENGVIASATAAAMGNAAGLRNVVAHGYAGVDVAIIFAAASHGVDDLETFASEVAAWVRRTTQTD